MYQRPASRDGLISFANGRHLGHDAVVNIAWVTAFLDMPADRFEEGANFWQRVTGSTRSSARGDEGQFATLVPGDGAAYLKVQRFGTAARLHLDLHVDDPTTAAADAARHGAHVVSQQGYVVMRSPGGFTFCFVAHRAAGPRPSPYSLEGAPPALPDQVTFDIPAPSFPREVDFWTAVTGWERRTNTVDPFAGLVRAAGMPLRFLFQLLGDADTREHTEAHLDVACSGRQAEVAEAHVAAGARIIGGGTHWITLADPVGRPYCLTVRDPATDAIPSVG
jgi:hypothetical protein